MRFKVIKQSQDYSKAWLAERITLIIEARQSDVLNKCGD